MTKYTFYGQGCDDYQHVSVGNPEENRRGNKKKVIGHVQDIHLYSLYKFQTFSYCCPILVSFGFSYFCAGSRSLVCAPERSSRLEILQVKTQLTRPFCFVAVLVVAFVFFFVIVGVVALPLLRVLPRKPPGPKPPAGPPHSKTVWLVLFRVVVQT